MREGKLDSIQPDNIRMLDPYEALDVFLDELELLTALVGSVIV